MASSKEKLNDIPVKGRSGSLNREKRKRGDSGEENVSEFSEVKNELRGMRETMDKMFSMVQKVMDRMDSIDERFSVMEKKLDDKSEEVDMLKKGMKAMEDKMLLMEDKMIDQEARSRRSNLIFHGVRESPREDCFKVVSDIIENGCQIRDRFVIERSHRLGRPSSASGSQSRPAKPRLLIVKFHDFNMRERVRGCRRLLPPEIKVTEDLPWQIRQARVELREAADEAKKSSRDVWISYPARLMVNGREVQSVRPATMQRQSRRDDASGSQAGGHKG